MGAVSLLNLLLREWFVLLRTLWLFGTVNLLYFLFVLLNLLNFLLLRLLLQTRELSVLVAYVNDISIPVMNLNLSELITSISIC